MQDPQTIKAVTPNQNVVSGEFTDISGERFYVVRNVDRMPPFFVSVVSDVDHWLFISSTGGLTAGRISPDTALFPYVTVDKIHESNSHTGSKTLLQVEINGVSMVWEPFKLERGLQFSTTRNVYKNKLGNKICFEEINHDLQILFRYTWSTSDRYGFVRHCELVNLANKPVAINLFDGLQNILPAGTPRFAQTNTSNLVDAYKWSEVDETTGLASFTLYSGITDRAEPSESLRANIAYCLGLDGHNTLISSEQLDNFRIGTPVSPEYQRRGIRGAYFVNHCMHLEPNDTRDWQIIADVELDQTQVVALHEELRDEASLRNAIAESVAQGSDELARIMASSDAFQTAAEENVVEHHYANVLFNVLRGGTFDEQYIVSSDDFRKTIALFNIDVSTNNAALLEQLPEKIEFAKLFSIVSKNGDPQLLRLCGEYLPIFFGRRHGDPSRPWNQFAIRVKDAQGKRLLSYQGNWRDIFQNWEALALSFPEYIENMIAKFVNASTIDGYNPYRITKEGIDWEVEEPDDPWSYIGYWGDHQIIYLQKLLEVSQQFHPDRLTRMLHDKRFAYANVPYRIKPFADLLRDPKNTVDFDESAAHQIDQRVADIGADGKLLLDGDRHVYQVSLLEKLIVPLLCKLSNFVADGGIWLNTQRPEWNDANNALVGQGLSMVTLCYLRRYIQFFDSLLRDSGETIELSTEVAIWLEKTDSAFADFAPDLKADSISASRRFKLLSELGVVACDYRRAVYARGNFSGTTTQSIETLRRLLENALCAIDSSIASNRRDDGLFNAYNLMSIDNERLHIDELYPMLEGQVAVLSAGSISPEQAISVVETLFKSDVYRPDQNSFMLYPDRKLPSFLEKNRIPEDQVIAIPLLQTMLANGDHRIVSVDTDGCYRFHADLSNAGELDDVLEEIQDIPRDQIDDARDALHALYEGVFNHQAFTGRSGGMFGFEGLGSIYWHMVSKLLLAVQENYFSALEAGADQATVHKLASLYYRVRGGIGFNKSPEEYGAFPTDPYSHTPKHVGARQPGMTGQVKEEIITRFGELGIRVVDGTVRFQPSLLRRREFLTKSQNLRFLDVNDQWQEIGIAENSIGFTWCQTPIVYTIDDTRQPGIRIMRGDGAGEEIDGVLLPVAQSKALFERTGQLRRLTVFLNSNALHDS